MINKNAIKITELALGSANESLLASRLRIDDALPLAEALDEAGYWSVETSGRKIFNSCLQYIGENPWDRIREIKKVMPKTKQQMSIQGQGLLGSRHYANDIVEKFVEHAIASGIDVLRIYDGLNDVRNLKTAIAATKKQGAHAQGAIVYSAFYNDKSVLVDMAKMIEDMGVDSLAVADVAGVLNPYETFELITALKKSLKVPIALHANAGAGLSLMSLLKGVEAGLDHIDTALSSLSMTNSFSPTESIVSALNNTEWASGLNLSLLEAVADNVSVVRKKYISFDKGLHGVDNRILRTHIPSAVLENISLELQSQGAEDKFSAAVEDVQKVQIELGSIPWSSTTADVMVDQALHNVLAAERYKSISSEVQSILKGDFGLTPGDMDKDLQKRVLNGGDVITNASSDTLELEFESLSAEVKEKKYLSSENPIDDILAFALFPQAAVTFFEGQSDSSIFEPTPQFIAAEKTLLSSSYSMSVNGKQYTAAVDSAGVVAVHVDGKSHKVQVNIDGEASVHATPSDVQGAGETVMAPLSGNIVKVLVKPGQVVSAGETLLVLEAMKMETEIKAHCNGAVSTIDVKDGDSVSVGDTLLTI
jgi:oxaloacetate decarboxylase (Na+ extruding) subunit alpha